MKSGRDERQNGVKSVASGPPRLHLQISRAFVTDLTAVNDATT
jgi:hypothetical protein